MYLLRIQVAGAEDCLLIAVIDGDDSSRTRLARLLTSEGFTVAESDDAMQGLRTAFDNRPHAFVVDLHSGRYPGAELVRILRAACDAPIVAVTSEFSAPNVVDALDAGADDVLPKACGAAEFLARVRSAVRRYETRRPEVSSYGTVRTGGIVIDRNAQSVTKDGARIALSRTEYRLLEALASRIGETAPHRYLLSTVWGDEYMDDTHYLRVYVGYLRAKLEEDTAQPLYLLNEWGVGYRLAKLPVVGTEAESRALAAR